MTAPPDDEPRRAQHLACLRSFFAALGRQDLDEAGRFCQPDFRMELPYSDPPAQVAGFTHYAAYVAAAFETFRFELQIEAVHDCVDPDLLIVEYTSSGQALPTGNPYANRYVGFWRFADGLIQAGREYYNPDAAREALASEPEDLPR